MVWAPEAHFDRHLPFALLTGFLGSGKTTLLNRLLTDPRLRDTAVAINEFGDVALDQHFVVARSEDVLVLANGCLCCFAGGDLEQSLARIFSRRDDGEIPTFKRLIIETSGVADPEYVLQAILDSPIMSRFLWLDSVVTTVDSLFGAEQIDRHAEALKQARIADRLVITKSDLASADSLRQVQARLREINPAAGQTVSVHADIEPAELFSPTFFDEDGDSSLIGEWVSQAQSQPGAGDAAAHDHATHARRHVNGIATLTLTATAPLAWRTFDLWLSRTQRRYGDKLLRVKGIINVADCAQPVVVHGVQSVSHVPVALASWPDEDRRTRLVFIFRDLDRASLEQDWQTFLATGQGTPARV
tara:strand:+ start:1147 stop:2223 length:1077 start_codon:yes stop_codon:yes gene_type:complete